MTGPGPMSEGQPSKGRAGRRGGSGAAQLPGGPELFGVDYGGDERAKSIASGGRREACLDLQFLAPAFPMFGGPELAAPWPTQPLTPQATPGD